jgi:predicted ATPase/DNA-binding CsgD family transcriptional regulator
MSVTEQEWAPAVPSAYRAAAPVGQATLVGREMETLMLAGRLSDPAARLLTLTGPGGVGKSRLARVAVEQAAACFAAVRTVDLTRVADAGEAARAAALAAETLRGTAEAGTVAGHGTGAGTGIAAGRAARTLLILDGCDHHGRELAAAVAQLLADDGALTVLATCQEPLRVYGEGLMPVAPLPVPRLGPALLHDGGGDLQQVQDVPSVALFVRRARDVDPSFALTAENVAAVAELCVLLEGLPLAVELAAGRLRLFPPQVLLARLRHRPAVLSGGPVDADERHRSLDALAAWSCRGLDAEQRALLGELAVHERGFGMPAVERASPLARAATETVLEALLDKNLVTVVEQEQGEPRFAVPEPVRSHLLTALEEDGRAEAARDRHAEHYQRLVAAVQPRLAGTEQERWLRLLAAEHPNVTAALRRLRERGDREAVAAVVTACRKPWLVQGRLREGLDWCDHTADGEGSGALPEPLRARLIDLSGAFAAGLGDLTGAVQRHTRALGLCKRLGDRKQTALVSARLGAALTRAGDHQRAQATLTPALTALESLGAAASAAEAATALAAALRAQGDHRKAGDLLDKALETYRRVRDSRGLGTALREVAAVAEDGEDLDAADRALRESLRLFDTVGELTELPASLEAFALLLLRTSPGQQPRVVRLLAAADGLRRSIGAVVPGDRAGVVRETLEVLRGRLHWTGFATAWAEGLRLSAPAATAEALAAPDPTRRVEQQAPEAQPLTPRQVQVAMLVAEGLTNRQIAGQLNISEWTVINHVRQVMRRLGCTSRVQVAWSVGRWP